MTSVHLFSPFRLRGLELANRITVSPMCQYRAREGLATDWHLVHLGNLAMSGAGLVILEATAVSPEGRISPGCLGLWSDAHAEALAPILAFCRRDGTARLGIQLGHAGRKGSCRVPLEGGAPLRPEEGAWRTVSASALPYDQGWPAPRAASEEDLAKIEADFVAATRRAAALGLDLVELHLAHGYLLHQFLSPLSNRRNDRWGGDLEGRMRFPLRVVEAVRAVWPEDRPLGVRVSATDWVEGGWDLEQTIALAQRLKGLGVDYVDVSSGGLDPRQKLTLGPGYQVPFAEAVRRASGLATMAVGLIVTPRQAESVLAEGKADLVALARTIMDDPRWPWHAAQELGVEIPYPSQYVRCRPQVWPGAAIKRAG
ncbi:MAG: NADH:flavin oxidoreductase/NADH oxidase [Geminicoccaceae bacterium]|nr:NADH:flavin oxidoreductase/NADH oxidase [Geminicoccaceae bacterium]